MGDIIKVSKSQLGTRRSGTERRSPTSSGAPFRGAERRTHVRRLLERDLGNARNVERDLRVAGQPSGYNTAAIDRGRIVSAPVRRAVKPAAAKVVSKGLLRGFAKKAAIVGLGAAAYGFYKEAKATVSTIGGDGNK